MNLDNIALDEVCKELDSLSLRMLQRMKEYINIKLKIEDVMKTGCFHLAKARYIMGNRNVSALQLPSEDSDLFASTTLLNKENNDTEVALSLELNRLNINDITKNDSDVRQRTSTKANDDETNKNHTIKKKSSIDDPMKWFGVLVPQDMRHAQSHFNKAIDYAVDCANIQIEILAIEEKYKIYLKKKLQLSGSQV